MMETHSSSLCVEWEHMRSPPRETGSRSSTTILRATPLNVSFTRYLPAGL